MPIEVSNPCPLCHRFFVEKACVPLTCGCLVHLHCMLEGVMLWHGTCPHCNLAASGCWLGQWGFPLIDATTVEIERMRTLLGQGCRISSTPKTTNSTFRSIMQLATTLIASDQSHLKKRRVDPSPARPAVDSITYALIPFWLFPSPPLTSHMAIKSIPNFCPPSSITTSVATGPLSTIEAQCPFRLAVSFMSLH